MMPDTISYQCRVPIYLAKKITVLKILAVARLPFSGSLCQVRPSLKRQRNNKKHIEIELVNHRLVQLLCQFCGGSLVLALVGRV